MLLLSSKMVHVPQKIIRDQLAILPILSKLLISKQLSKFFENILSKVHFRKGYGAQRSLLMILETGKEGTDNIKVFGALLTDRSKAFDC